MPRRNRRARSTRSRPIPIRVLTDRDRDDLRIFAQDHLAAHEHVLETAEPYELATTFSEHLRTGTCFASAGDCFDRLAVQLAAGVYPSGHAVNLSACSEKARGPG